MEMKSIKIDSNIKNTITQTIPDYLIQKREGGGKKMLSYLSGSTVIDILNNAFGYAWSWEVKREWITESSPYFNGYAKGNDLVNHNGRQGKWETQGPIAHVLGTLTVYMESTDGIVTLKKDGYGSKSIMGKQNDQESIFKAAGTDALKKAASLFGVGLQLYRKEEEQYYFDVINYEDPWTDEMKETYANELQYIDDYKQKYKVTDEAFDTFVGQVTQNTTMITPDNIEYIVNYIRSSIEGEGYQEEE